MIVKIAIMIATMIEVNNMLLNDKDEGEKLLEQRNKASRQKKRLLMLPFHLMSNYKVVNIIALHQLGT
jgi:hypothetical protein